MSCLTAPNDVTEQMDIDQSAAFPSAMPNDMATDEFMEFPNVVPNDLTEQMDINQSAAFPNATPNDMATDEIMDSPNVVPNNIAEGLLASKTQFTSHLTASNNMMEEVQSAGFPNATPNDMVANKFMGSPNAAPNDIAERLLANNFVSSLSQEILNSIVTDFIDATSNKALKVVACGSCARETNMNDCEEVLLKDIPNKHQLVPHTAHPAHELVDGLLIYTPALSISKKTVYLCNECQNQLKKNVRPRLSLSNSMWIGDIPRELQGLTLPERLLLAKYFPTAYIIKLFPKQKNASAWDHSQMHSALKGNVSTYRLDPRQVARMVDGRLFPPPAKILAATIGITFVGPKGLREPTMPAMFRVRRWRVREALLWLKANNPLYTDIEISEERLSELPEDGVPEELMMTAKYSSDTKAVEREHDGYVPTDAADDIEGVYQVLLYIEAIYKFSYKRTSRVDEGNRTDSS